MSQLLLVNWGYKPLNVKGRFCRHPVLTAHPVAPGCTNALKFTLSARLSSSTFIRRLKNEGIKITVFVRFIYLYFEFRIKDNKNENL